LVFDITNKKSFNAISFWLEDIRNYGPDNIEIIIIGNKLDKSYQRDVSFEEAKSFCEKNKIKYFEVSALNGKNITDVFKILSKNMIDVEIQKERRRNNTSYSGIKLDNKNNNNNSNKSISFDRTKDINFEEDIEVKNKFSCC